MFGVSGFRVQNSGLYKDNGRENGTGPGMFLFLKVCFPNIPIKDFTFCNLQVCNLVGPEYHIKGYATWLREPTLSPKPLNPKP